MERVLVGMGGQPCLRLPAGDDRFFLVDEHNAQLVEGRTFRLHYSDPGHPYVVFSNSKGLYLHRRIMKVSDPGLIVDHRNGITLDLRESNLRVCSKGDNSCNKGKKRRPATSRFVGVHYEAGTGMFVAKVSHRLQTIFFGRFNSEREAAGARDSFLTTFEGGRLSHRRDYVFDLTREQVLLLTHCHKPGDEERQAHRLQARKRLPYVDHALGLITIPLPDGEKAITDYDWAIYERIKDLTFWVTRSGGRSVVCRIRPDQAEAFGLPPRQALRHGQDRRMTVRVTHLLKGAPTNGYIWDHKDGDPLNNRLANLRQATRRQNSQNRMKPKNGSVPFIHVSRCGPNFVVKMTVDKDGKPSVLYGRSYVDPRLAALHSDYLARRHHGAFTHLNYPGVDIDPADLARYGDYIAAMRRSRTGRIGVTFSSNPHRPYRVVVHDRSSGHQVYSRLFISLEEAAGAFDRVQRQFNGERSLLNLGIYPRELLQIMAIPLQQFMDDYLDPERRQRLPHFLRPIALGPSSSDESGDSGSKE